MTRVNVVPVEALTRQHLQGEYKEISRVFGLARKAQFDVIKGKKRIPLAYTLGTGHVLFFYDKLKYIHDRYFQLVSEMRNRGYKPNAISSEELLAGINVKLYNDYIPTEEAKQINLERINLRLGV